MVLSSEDFAQLLFESIRLKNKHQFKYIFEDLKVNLDEPQKALSGLSIFEKVLETPNTREFIEQCIENGSDFFRKNDVGVYPLNYAVLSLSAENLQAMLISSSKGVVKSRDVHLSIIVNQKFERDNNYLHFLIEKLTEQNYEEVSEMIKILIRYNCSPNSANDKLETPFYLLLTKLRAFSINSDLVEFFINNAHIDFYSFKPNEILKLIEERRQDREILHQEPIKDANFMNRLLEQFNERKFVEEFENFIFRYQSSNNLKNDFVILLETAVVRNMSQAVTLLLASGANASEIPMASKLRIPPAFIACFFGHHEVLSVLICDLTLNFRSKQSNLLHQVCYENKACLSDRQKCFDMIIADSRCTQEIINEVDILKQVPLYYACHQGFSKIAIELLRRGAFIGHKSVIDNISKKILSEFLDECIKSSKDVLDRNCKINIDFRCLVPMKINDHLEISSVRTVADNPKLTELVLHPVITTFLHYKWRKYRWPVYFNLFFYFAFLMFLGMFIITHFKSPGYNNYNKLNDTDNLMKLLKYREYKSERVDGQKGVDSLARFLNDLKRDEEKRIRESQKSTTAEPSPSENDEQGDYKIWSSILGKRRKRSTVAEESAKKMEAFTVGQTTAIKCFEAKYPDASIFEQPDDSENPDKTAWRSYCENMGKHVISYRICVFGILLMALYEIIQCVISFEKYFFKVSNWLDIFMIGLAYRVLIHSLDFAPMDFNRIRAITILVMAAQTIQLIAKVPILSMSLHLAIFKKVCVTFLKTIALYMVLILAFAMSFYTMIDTEHANGGKHSKDSNETEVEDDDVVKRRKSFKDPFISVISTVRMMLSDFDIFKLEEDDGFQGLIFLLFVVLITVVLFNLLNALAISDTYNILKDAELVDTKKRISIVVTYEKLFKFLSISCCNIFPDMSEITITPHKGNEINVVSVRSNFRDLNNFTPNTGIIQKFINVFSSVCSKKQIKALKMNQNLISKIVDFVKLKQIERGD